MWDSLDKIQVCSGPVGAWVGRYLGTSVRMKSIPGVFVPQEKTYLAQGDRAGCQADEAPFPAVGVLGQGKLLRQGLDHMFDLHGVVLGHEVPHQPGEEGERGYGTGETRLSCGLGSTEMTFTKEDWGPPLWAGPLSSAATWVITVALPRVLVSLLQ